VTLFDARADVITYNDKAVCSSSAQGVALALHCVCMC
jgi:hypothetical protein